ncbi:MAG: hypothetical protein ACHQ0J_05020 [Candidatus Dormibacterales bacterium]
MPMLIGEQVGSGWRVWCPHCRVYHHHGAGGGHRRAHCTDPKSPYRETGYVVISKAKAQLLDRRTP